MGNTSGKGNGAGGEGGGTLVGTQWQGTWRGEHQSRDVAVGDVMGDMSEQGQGHGGHVRAGSWWSQTRWGTR